MTEVIQRKIDVLVTYSTPAAVAARNATNTIPIVVAVMGDPIGAGIVTNLSRPGGNLTGLSLEWAEGIEGKWLELLQDMVPQLSTVAVLVNLNTPVHAIQEMAKKLEVIAPSRGVKIRLIEIGKPDSFDGAFKRARNEAQAALILGDVFTFEHRRQLTALAARYQLPAIYPLREYVDAGGLMAYGADRAILFRRAAEYVDKILKGAKPGDLPIEQPTKFELVVNLKTAKALGLKVPESILLRADEVVR
jgi:putative ABC transport system substrate-binding protein